MAFRRSLTARAKVFYQRVVVLPLSSGVDRDRDDNDRRRQELQIHDLRRRFTAGDFCRSLCGDRRFAAPAAFAPRFVRNMSTSSKGEGLGAENAPITSDSFEMAKETAEKAVEAVTPAANEMATGVFPVDVFQQLIHHVHTFSGCNNWLVSIVLSTILLRTLLLPLTIHQTKATYIFTLIRHEVKEIQREISKSRNEKNPIAAAVGEARMRKLLNEYGLSRFTVAPSLTVLIFGNTSFLLAMLLFMNSKEVNEGGASYSYILPLLTAFTFWRAMKCHGDAIITSKSIGVVAALLVPFSALLPTGVLCSWITSNLYGLVYGTVMKNGKVKKMLGIPNIAEAPRFEVDPLVTPASTGEWILPLQNLVVFLLTLSIKFY